MSELLPTDINIHQRELAVLQHHRRVSKRRIPSGLDLPGEPLVWKRGREVRRDERHLPSPPGIPFSIRLNRQCAV